MARHNYGGVSTPGDLLQSAIVDLEGGATKGH